IGTYGIAVMHQDAPGLIVGARRGSPLVIGLGKGENFLASDVNAVVGRTHEAIFLRDHDIVTLREDRFEITTLDGAASGFAHITGGGIYENIPRSMGAGMRGRIEKKSLRTPPIFDILMKTGGIPEEDMFHTFNMGVGMCLTVAKDDVNRALSLLRVNGEDAYVVGEVECGEGGLALC
ncbi:MAG: AIR synthase-related protein, partial [Clostridia bacterium]|nr:AIR synthase-related protein [Clostridia bacterium]